MHTVGTYCEKLLKRSVIPYSKQDTELIFLVGFILSLIVRYITNVVLKYVKA